MRLSPRGNYIMMFPSSTPTQKSIFNCRTVGAVTIAAALSALFLIDTDEIMSYSNKLNLRAYAVDSSGVVCKECQGVWTADYDYEADYEKWDALYGKVQTIRLLGERHSGTNWITDHLSDCFGEDIPVS
jgi:hypothetical protein